MGKTKLKKSAVNVLKSEARTLKDKVVGEKKFRSPYLDYEYDEVVEFMCPIRGLVKQKVKIKRLKTQLELPTKHIVPNTLSPVEAVELDHSLADAPEIPESSDIDNGVETSED